MTYPLGCDISKWQGVIDFAKMKANTAFVFVKATESWDGDARSTTAKTKIDLSEVFGVPAGVKAVIVKLIARDSGSATTAPFFNVSPNNVSDSAAVVVSPRGLPNDTLAYNNGVVSCDANGDIYYQIYASGTGAMDAWLEIWGWWL